MIPQCGTAKSFFAVPTTQHRKFIKWMNTNELTTLIQAATGHGRNSIRLLLGRAVTKCMDCEDQQNNVPKKIMTPMTAPPTAINIFSAAFTYGSITFCTDVMVCTTALLFHSSFKVFEAEGMT